MSFERGVRSVVGSSLWNRLCRRPRLVATLLLLVLLVAVQGGAVADPGHAPVDTQENEMGSIGP
ncbi:MAG: hypothetical protein ABEI99_10275 [Halobaculum sp.]